MTNAPAPKTWIMNIAPYVPGRSVTDDGRVVAKLSSNENPLGTSDRARAAFADRVADLARYPDASASFSSVARSCAALSCSAWTGFSPALDEGGMHRSPDGCNRGPQGSCPAPGADQGASLVQDAEQERCPGSMPLTP